MPPKPEPTELDTCKRTRAGAAGWLTRAAKNCDTYKQLDLKAAPLAEYENLLMNFEKRLKSWEEAESNYEMLVDDGELDDTIQTSADFLEKMERARTDLISAWTTAHPVVPAAAAASAGDSHRTNTQAAKLPKLDLPKFSGDVMKFLLFWQQFVACVEDQELPNVTKFNYLLGLLKGDAKTVLDGLPVT